MKRNIISITALSVAIVLFFVAFSFHSGGDRAAYVSISKLYEEFELTKSLNADYEKVSNKRQMILDSLSLQLSEFEKYLYKQENRDEEQLRKYYAMKEHFLKKEQEFSQNNQLLSKKYNEQIMNQLNQYVEDYGEEKSYDYIYGANGNGTLMYANKKNDITEPLVEYVNHRFAGKK